MRNAPSVPLIERARVLRHPRQSVFDGRERSPQDKGLEVLTVEAREGLSVAGVTVRYRIDPGDLTTFRPIFRSRSTKRLSLRW